MRQNLDIREINGYTIHHTPFHPADDSGTIRTLVYIGTPDNEQFTGPQDPQALAEHIYHSSGPSGLNKDYLLSLDVALDELCAGSGDGHVKDLARRVRELEAQAKNTDDADMAPQLAISYELAKTVSTGTEHEETEKIVETGSTE